MRSPAAHLLHRVRILTSSVSACGIAQDRTVGLTAVPVSIWTHLTPARNHGTLSGLSSGLGSLGQPVAGAIEPVSAGTPAIAHESNPLSPVPPSRPASRGFAKEVSFDKLMPAMAYTTYRKGGCVELPCIMLGNCGGQSSCTCCPKAFQRR